MKIPTHLEDSQLLAAVARLARGERDATAQLVAHLAEMDARDLHLREGYRSLFAYCRDALRLSESATCKRIEAARAARRFPVVLDRLAEGSLNVSTLRVLGSKLTPANHLELLSAAAGLTRREVEALVARRFPRPDVATLVRRLPAPRALPILAAGVGAAGVGAAGLGGAGPASNPASSDASLSIAAVPGSATVPASAATVSAAVATASAAAAPARPSGAASEPEALLTSPDAWAAPSLSTPRPIAPFPSRAQRLATPLSADRYLVRFTARAATVGLLREAQDMLRHAVPDGEPDEIVHRALKLLVADLARRKSAQVKKPRTAAASRPAKRAAGETRHPPSAIKRAVWQRDAGSCAYRSPSGRRCGSRVLLEYHHVRPYGVGGGWTVDNIELRCRAHNGYEARVFYGSIRRGQAGSPDRRDGAGRRSLSAQDSTSPGAGSRGSDETATGSAGSAGSEAATVSTMVGSAALGSTALGSAALGSTAFGPSTSGSNASGTQSAVRTSESPKPRAVP